MHNFESHLGIKLTLDLADFYLEFGFVGLHKDHGLSHPLCSLVLGTLK